MSLRLSKTSFPNSLSLETTLSSESRRKPRPADTFFFPCINSEIHKVNCRIAAREGGLGHAPGIYEFAKQMRLNACCRTKHKKSNIAFFDKLRDILFSMSLIVNAFGGFVQCLTRSLLLFPEPRTAWDCAPRYRSLDGRAPCVHCTGGVFPPACPAYRAAGDSRNRKGSS